MTSRGWALLVVAAALALVGWRSNWPELVALGASGIIAVAVVVAALGSRPRALIAVDQGSLRVVRGQAATVRIALEGAASRRGLRLAEGPDRSAPSGTLPIAPRILPGPSTLRFPLDTSRRGQRPMGPFTLVQGDPWGLVQRVVDSDQGGLVTIQPRVFPVRRALVSQNMVGDSDTADKRRGDVHFHALRDYVMGDEPRMIAWRSSARAGHLVVRQNLAPTTTGTTVVLDTDITAYGSDHQFGASWLPERFETAVEVAASIIASLPKSSGQVHLLTTEHGSRVVSAAPGATNGLLDHLAVVEASRPLDVTPAALVSAVRSTRCSRLIVVTGTPSRMLPSALVAATRSVTGTLVVRVGCTRPEPLAGLRVLDITTAEELV